MFDTERFIMEVERRPAIYDVNCKAYNDRTAKMNAWDEVCEVMVPNWEQLADEERNSEEKNLRGKWRNIRDYFIKELKLQQSRTPGPAGRKRKKYMYFDQLLFLMPMVENKRNLTTTATYQGSGDSDAETDNPMKEEYDTPILSAPSSSNDFLQNAYPKARYPPFKYSKSLCETSMPTFDTEFQEMLSSHSSQRVADEEDYDRMFLLSLLPTLRQISEAKKLDVRIQIQQVLAAALIQRD